jgi:TrmH family RNA methyltransferase
LAAQNHLDNLRVVLVSTRNPLNIGASARAMSNFGVSKLRVVNPYNPAFREAVSAVGASELLRSAEEFSTLEAAVADCSLVIGTTAAQDRELHHPLRVLQDGARIIRKRLASGKVGLLFGSEKHGLRNEELSHCHWLMHIPTCEGHLSMNLGQSVAVCLYELARADKSKRSTKDVKRASSAELDRLTKKLLAAISGSGWIKTGAEATAEEKLRRLVHRLDVSSADSTVLTGMFHKIVWKIHSKK